MGQRSVLVAAGWLGAAMLAVLVGLGAINVIGDGLTTGSGNALSPADVARQLTAAASIPPSPAPVTTSAAARRAVRRARRRRRRPARAADRRWSRAGATPSSPGAPAGRPRS